MGYTYEKIIQTLDEYLVKHTYDEYTKDPVWKFTEYPMVYFELHRCNLICSHHTKGSQADDTRVVIFLTQLPISQINDIQNVDAEEILVEKEKYKSYRIKFISYDGVTLADIEYKREKGG